LIRQWGKHTDYFIVVGDDDQCIYSFTGATPDAFLAPDIPKEHKIILSQSYRVPRAVHELANRWIVEVKPRQPKEYQPTTLAGEVRHLDYHWQNPGTLLDDARKYDGKTVMFLTACAYMLEPLKKELRARGVPFHNPYRLRRADWNPLTVSKKISARDRVLAFLMPHDVMGESSRPWTAEEFRRWSEWVKTEGVFQHGMKTALKLKEPDQAVDGQMIAECLTEDAAQQLLTLMDGDYRPYLRWWLERVLAPHVHKAEYPCTIATDRGIPALYERPRVIIGTIHSVKGGEADVVYLFPDLSAAGAREWGGFQESKDAVVRQFYVGMTRARETLVICQSLGCGVPLR
jgi:ATP-dependent exoDNAse (exonuclease V) beta subunit